MCWSSTVKSGVNCVVENRCRSINTTGAAAQGGSRMSGQVPDILFEY